MKTATTTVKLRAMVMAALFAACTNSTTGPTEDPVGDPPVAPPPTAPPATSGNEETTYDHMNDMDVDPFELLARMGEEGPPEFSARLHSCPKMKYRTIGRVLASRGVNLQATGQTTAGFLYTNADQALGAPNYAARISESTELTTASAAKLFDIWVAAAPEIIANMPNIEACKVGGVGARMFNDAGQCTADGIACLIGMPATLQHIEFCNTIVVQASTPELGRTIAVAALASAAHTCE